MTLTQAFAQQTNQHLNIYYTAGYPQLTSTLPILQHLQQHGATMVEIGMPYSDPLADGTTIQQSSAIALQNGMSIAVLLQQLKNCRNTISLPIILMGYLNPLLQYGFEKFCKQASIVGVNALIIPDMPVHDFTSVYRNILLKYNLDLIFLITPNTPVERVKLLDSLSTGFLYVVASNATTGTINTNNNVEIFLKKLKKLQLHNPLMVGFGISNAASFHTVCKHTNGCIIGSAFINVLTNSTPTTLGNTIKKFLTQFE